MPSVDSESSQDNRATLLARSGTIVLSSSCRLLYIDRRAVELVDLLDSDTSEPPPAQALPACLMKLAQELAAADYVMRKDGSSSWFKAVHRLVGSPSKLVRVQALSTLRLGQDREDGRIVLVLSRSDQGTVL